MATRSSANDRQSEKQDGLLTKIRVAGFKSIRDEQSIDVAPLTILAGANSSGKSSIMQPLLLLKQTLEVNYDPGPLLLNGPNVRFTETEQLLSRSLKGKPLEGFQVGAEFGPRSTVSIRFRKRQDGGFDIAGSDVVREDAKFRLTPRMRHGTIESQFPPDSIAGWGRWIGQHPNALWRVVRKRCFLNAELQSGGESIGVSVNLTATNELDNCLRNLIHVPALRRGPERTYTVTAVGATFPGTFDHYVASVIEKWQTDKNRKALTRIDTNLRTLGLSSEVVANRLSGAELELQVGRLPRRVPGGAQDLVSIADVGFGVSQVLPVVVALRVANRERLVYLEQPEIHLHPRAQVALATVLADAVKRGVRIILETHSHLLLLAIQTLVADGQLASDLVKLHWFTRSATDGVTTIDSADLDKAGAFGDWPEDFGDVELDIESRYLDAAEARMTSK